MASDHLYVWHYADGAGEPAAMMIAQYLGLGTAPLWTCGDGAEERAEALRPVAEILAAAKGITATLTHYVKTD